MNDIIFFSFNEMSSVLLIFFINALVFSFLLLRNGIQKNSQSSKWLAAFIFLGGLYICPFMFGYAGWYSKTAYREFLFFVPFQQLFLIGPVLFFYIQSLLKGNFKITKKDLIHFLPAILYFGYSLIVFVVDKLVLDEFYFYADGKDKDLSVWYQVAGLVSMLFYLILSLKYYRDYRKFSQDEVSFADEVSYKWINYFLIVFGIILLLRVLFFILNPEWWEFGSKFWYYLCFSILLFYIAINGYFSTIRSTDRIMHTYANRLQNYSPVPASEEVKEESSPADLKEWKHKIGEHFRIEHSYKNPNLTLTEIASQLNTNRSLISNVINQEFKMNFNDYVNSKRTEAVIEKLKEGEHLKSTLLGIALECGFNSKTTFNRAFKKHTGLTPKQFIDKNIE